MNKKDVSQMSMKYSCKRLKWRSKFWEKREPFSKQLYISHWNLQITVTCIITYDPYDILGYMKDGTTLFKNRIPKVRKVGQNGF